MLLKSRNFISFLFISVFIISLCNGSNICDTDPCRNNGTCVTSNNVTYTCNCTEAWTGENCTMVNPCLDNLCSNNSTCVYVTSNEYICECPSGYMGKYCNMTLDKCNNTCRTNEQCNDQKSICECIQGFERTHNFSCVKSCVTDFGCENNSTCINSTGTPFCDCMPGFNGDKCENHYDFCLPNPCQFGGICANRAELQTYECFCPQGYVGLHCESELRACVSSPCYNGTCLEHPEFDGAYECVCAAGFKGINCQIDIDDCADDPCKNGGSCTDHIDAYSCSCAGGWEGINCTININECESSPCQNNGTCVDEINKYTCDCLAGYTSDHCETEINECESNPCQHNTTCIDEINAYSCNCSGSGYEGVNCEIEINECLSSPCKNDANCTDLINDFQCQCHPGYKGRLCLRDINECELNLCQHNSTCLERSNQNLYEGIFFPGNFSYSQADGYVCNCTAGYEGVNCESEINECLTLPCANDGVCVDLLADYECVCNESYDGKNCSVRLRGCDGKCDVNGTDVCIPSLVDEIQDIHDYKCQCSDGYTGRHCNISTSVTFGERSFVQISQDNFEVIKFGFKTNQQQGPLLKVNDLFSVFIQSGTLYISFNNTNFSTNISVFDAQWHQLIIKTDNQQLDVKVRNEGVCASTCKFNFTFDVSTGTKNITFGSNVGFSEAYHGCMRDIQVDNQLFYSSKQNNEFNTWNGILEGCSRTQQCFENTCMSRGTCKDLWDDFTCFCNRPYIGWNCSTEVTTATFSHESNTSYAEFDISELTNIFPLSLFIRTRDMNGLIVAVVQNGSDVLFSLALDSGKLKVSSNSQVFETDIMVNDAQTRFIEVKLSEENILRLFVDDNKVLESLNATLIAGSSVYVGGMPVASSGRRRRQVYEDNQDFYKGTIQDVEMNKNKLLFFDQDYEGNHLLPVYLSNVLSGELQDDVCSNVPCNNSGTCIDEFNQRSCECNGKWRGEDCSQPAFCVTASCTNGSRCQDTVESFECVPTITTDGDDITFIPMTTNIVLEEASMNFRTRLRSGEIITINFIDNSSFQLALELMITAFDTVASNVDLNNGEWHSLRFNSSGLFMDNMQVSMNSTLDFTNKNISSVSIGKVKGCLQDVRINGFVLPLLNDTSGYSQFKLLQTSTVPKPGCHGDDVCSSKPCTFGSCNDNFNIYNCTCDSGYFGLNCSEETNECLSSPCVNGQCIDQVNNYTCQCVPGYDGVNCENDIDECASAPCVNNGTCVDLVDEYLCNCTTNFIGDHCQFDISNACTNQSQCLNGGECKNVTTNDAIVFNCTCLPQYTGDMCQDEVDFCGNVNCGNGTCVQLKEEATYTCECSPGYTGNHCGTDIDECLDMPCQNNATCQNENGSYSCICTKGWSSTHCDVDINECLTNDCSLHGNCTNYNGTFHCGCEEGYEGKSCEVKGPCADKPCVRGECFQNTAAMEYRCECDPGWMNANCSTFDKCSLKPCQNEGTCTQDESEVVACDCTGTGFSGMNCTVDIDECETEAPCGNKASCINQLGSYKCNCVPKNGYFDKDCQVRNRCVTNDGSKYCLNDGICSLEFNNKSNGTQQICNCSRGYAGLNCQHPVRCIQEPDICRHGGKCLTTWSEGSTNLSDPAPGYTCICRTGYSGTNCQSFAWLVAGSTLGAVGFILLIVVMVIAIMYVRRLRQTKGEYEPRATELENTTTASTDMFQFGKPPLKTIERLI